MTAAGDLFLVTAKRIAEGGIETRPLTQLKVQDDPDAAYHATRLADGRLAVYTSGTKPHLWLINSGGGMDSELALTEPLQIDPVNFGNSLILPHARQFATVGPLGVGRTRSRFPLARHGRMHRLPGNSWLRWRTINSS